MSNQMRTLKPLIIALFLPYCFAGWASAFEPQDSGDTDAKKPNIILLMADDLGYADLSCFGSPAVKTPHLDGLAKDGTKFTRFYAASAVCSPTRASVLTGRYPLRFGITKHFNDRDRWLPESATTVAELLKKSDYNTVHVGKWHLGGLHVDGAGKRKTNQPGPRQHGFDFYQTQIEQQPLRGQMGKKKTIFREGGTVLLRNDQRIEKDDPYYPKHFTDANGDFAVEMIEKLAADPKPFFINMWWLVPHKPYEPAPEPHWSDTAAEGISADQHRFRSMMQHMDAKVGQILSKLDELGIADNTLVIFTSDNGAAYEGYIGDLKGGKTDLHDGGIRVPMIARWPGKIPAGRVSDSFGHSNDLLPTFCAAAGVELPDDNEVDGINLLPLMKGEESIDAEDRGTVFWQLDLYKHLQRRYPKPKPYATEVAMRGKWKLLAKGGEPVELFDIVADPNETKNLIADYSEVVDSLTAEVKAWLQEPRSSEGVKSKKKTNARKKTSQSQPPYDGSWDSLQKMPVPAWFDDGKIGIFIHWGPYSKIGYRKGGRGYAEHVPKMMYRDADHYFPVIKERWGATPPEFGYKDIIPEFKAEKWDPDAWAKLFADVGFKYCVMTAEHHDGWANWDSDLTPWNAMDMGPRRDLVGDLGKALKKQGLKFAPSYHRERHQSFFAKKLYVVDAQPLPMIAEEIKRVPLAASLYGPFGTTKAFVDDYVARWKEIQEKYQPDMLWMDDFPIYTRDGNNVRKGKAKPEIQYFDDQVRGMITDFMNDGAARGAEVYVNNKGKNRNWPAGVGCLEKDNLKLKVIGPKWESCTTFGSSFGYLEGDSYKRPSSVIREMVEVISRNGNFLVNIGPRSDGTIPEPQMERLMAMKHWLAINGEAIYGSRYWKQPEQKDEHLAFTTNGKKLFAIKLKKPVAPFVISGTAGWAAEKIKAVRLLGSDAEVASTMTKAGFGDHAAG